ncbi:hypothetical protein DXA76_08550 [Bifidobacterium adolescentis]|nr:hypothetical protein DWZ00_08460 [Bifidobacterium adolescentis]RGX57325.1 hypothetical protein DXA76_08550 [Bifidobacterium adolescentis]RGX57525.1 hypothetical protein DXA77_08325 [Bifidobacterium adolescentis]
MRLLARFLWNPITEPFFSLLSQPAAFSPPAFFLSSCLWMVDGLIRSACSWISEEALRTREKHVPLACASRFPALKNNR